MDDVRVLDIIESSQPGRWVLATIGGYDDSVSYELTFAPDIAPREWEAIAEHLPLGVGIRSLHGVGGELLGRRHALMATIT